MNSGFLEYRVEFDEKRMIVRKYYRTKNLDLCIMTVLEEIINEIKSQSSNQQI